MTLLCPKLHQFRGLVFVSSVHNFNVTAWGETRVLSLFDRGVVIFHTDVVGQVRQAGMHLAG